MRAPTILVIDDDREFLDLAQAMLEDTYQVQTARDARQALATAGDTPPDLILLDLMLPDLDGFRLAEQIRTTCPAPVVVLSGRTSSQDKVRALDLGADDYVTKPVDQRELLARIRAVLRRVQHEGTPRAVLVDGPLRIDFERHLVTRDDVEVRLTPTEYALLAELAHRPGKLFGHSELLRKVWGPEYGSEYDYLRVFVRRLRRKIEPDPDNPRFILTEARAGYRYHPVDLA